MTNTPHAAQADLVPKYWRHEGHAYLGASMRRYIAGEELSVRDMALIRGYLRDWVDSPTWDATMSDCPERLRRLSLLRAKAFAALSRDQIEDCIQAAASLGLDPL